MWQKEGKSCGGNPHRSPTRRRTAPGVCLLLFLPSASTFWPLVTNSLKIRPTPNFYTHYTLKNVHHRFFSGFCKAIPALLGIAILLFVVKNARNVFQRVDFGPLWPNFHRRPIFMVCHGSIPRWNPPITLLHGGA